MEDLMRDKKVNVNGMELHVVDYDGEGEAIVCVHGLTANSRCWNGIAERLTLFHHFSKYEEAAMNILNFLSTAPRL